jgi:hypothetical protein
MKKISNSCWSTVHDIAVNNINQVPPAPELCRLNSYTEGLGSDSKIDSVNDFYLEKGFLSKLLKVFSIP